jgi:hypothetical protein
MRKMDPGRTGEQRTGRSGRNGSPRVEGDVVVPILLYSLLLPLDHVD